MRYVVTVTRVTTYEIDAATPDEASDLMVGRATYQIDNIVDKIETEVIDIRVIDTKTGQPYRLKGNKP